MEYNHKDIETKWQKKWEENKTFKTDMWDFSKPKYYALDMFSYPSGANLHLGHISCYTPTDIMARFKRMQGYNVLHPTGFDSFGLPAEQYAIKTGNHPGDFTQNNINTFIEQLKVCGLSYDFENAISTCDPDYYKWTQWIFLNLFKDGIAKMKAMPVNYCEELGTVLANDEVIDGKSEIGGFPVIRKMFNQWVIDIPSYAEKLLNGLETLDWPESTKEMQRNWIGKSEGVEVEIKTSTNVTFKIFTTCIETIYGITFFVLAPESKIVEDLKPYVTNLEEVESYQKETEKKSEFERSEMNTGKTGVELKGVYAINPVNGKEVKIYAGDFVIASYGTGAVMAVPSHDQRDYDFAKLHNIDIIEVITGGDISVKAFEKNEYLGKGCKLINSEEFTGLTVEEAKKQITEKLVKEGIAKRTTNFRLRDWIFARQRYWGEPVPVVHLENGEIAPLKESDLPLTLPNIKDYKSKSGKAPLDNAEEWVNVTINGIKGKRETSTMPGSAGSSWYFLRFIDPFNKEEFANYELLKHWMPVDLYIGGPEHAVGHLLYSRMWNRYLFEKGYAPTEEPFTKLVHQGMILGANGIKMGKRYPEFAIDPRTIIKEYGADSLRLCVMFLGPITVSKPWNDKSIAASRKFIERVFRLYTESGKIQDKENKNLEVIYNQTVKKVTEDYENLAFNTAIAQIMTFVNAVYKEDIFPVEYAEGLIKMLSPIIPHIAEEIWTTVLGHNNTISYEKFPIYDETKLTENLNTMEIPVQVNGKLKVVLNVNKDITQDEIIKLSLDNEKVKLSTDGKQVLKTIYIPNRLVNIVVK